MAENRHYRTDSESRHPCKARYSQLSIEKLVVYLLMPDNYNKSYSPLLAIDSATSACSVAVLSADGNINARSILTNRRHNEALSSLTAEILEEGKVKWSDLEAIIVSIGPGSFTGLRVGVSYAKGAALALGIPVLPVSTLQLLAETFRESHHPVGRFMPLIPARKAESFGQIYFIAAGVAIAESEPILVDLTIARQMILDGVLLFGEGVEQFQKDLQLTTASDIVLANIRPSPVELIRLGGYLFHGDGLYPTVSDVEPVYLKEFTVKMGTGLS